MGVGGDVGWLRTVRPRYRVPAGRHRRAGLLTPFTSSSPPSDLSDLIPPELSSLVKRDYAEKLHEPVTSMQQFSRFVLPDTPSNRRLLLTSIGVAVMAVAVAGGSLLIGPDGVAW